MAAERTTSDTSERSEGMGKALKRRGLMAGAAALVVGIAAKQTSQPVAASTSLYDAFIATSGGDYAYHNYSSTNYGYGAYLWGSGTGVYGLAYSTTNGNGVQGDGAGTGIGVLGNGGSSNGFGVQGNGAGTGIGVLGNGGGTSGIGVKGVGGAPNGIGVQGNGTGAAPGVYGASSGDATTKGVHGQHAGSGFGTYGQAGTGGVGVGGDASSTGVMGRGGGDTTANTTGFPIGVRGSVPNTGYGVYGNAGSGYGVYGNAPGGVGVGGAGGTGVMGTSGANANSKGVYGHHTGNGYGVYGDAGDGGYGVTGVATTAYGVVGQSNSGTGVLGGIGGSAPNTIGVHGDNRSSGANGVGVRGDCANGNGVYGQSATGYGVLGYSTGGSASLAGISTNANIPAFAGGNSAAGGLAASFSGTVYVNGPFVVQDPANKHGAIRGSDGKQRLVYAMEAPEPWLEDFGTGTLANGRAEIKLEPRFADVIHTDSYHVFITGHDKQSEGHAVTARHADGFVVEERKGGAGSGTFSWRVVARPKSEGKGERLAEFVPPAVKLPTVADLPKPAPPPDKKP